MLKPTKRPAVRKKHILIADRDSDSRHALCEIFRSEYTVETAENSAEGLGIIAEHGEQICAILLGADPFSDGIELLRELHERRITKRIPVFLIISYDKLSVAQPAYDMGIMDVIVKPYVPFVVFRRVQTVIELFSTRETLRATVIGQNEKLRENANTIDVLHKNAIEALASAIEFRDVESGAHTNRIYAITKYLLSCTEMGEGLTAAEIENISIGAIMHDIGKIAISDVILNKPGKLTPEAYEAMKQHTVRGGELMERLIQMQEHESYIYAYDIARHHHERWDGGGYPDGLSGDEISVWAQVVAIADVYDALVSPRVYKKVYTPDEAVFMIKNGECGVFSPKLLSCFFELEGEIRKWYEPDFGDTPFSLGDIPPRVGTDAEELPELSQELIDVLLLTAAVKSAYDIMISVNLTEDSYYIIDSEKFLTAFPHSGESYGRLIELAADTVPECDRGEFVRILSRDSLLTAYARGEHIVRTVHTQYADSGKIMTVTTCVLFMEDPKNGDVRVIILARYVKDVQEN